MNYFVTFGWRGKKSVVVEKMYISNKLPELSCTMHIYLKDKYNAVRVWLSLATHLIDLSD